MTYTTPSLKAEVEASREAFRAEMPGSDAHVWPNNLYVVAKVLGGLQRLKGQALQWLYNQRFVKYCDVDALEIYADEYGLTRKPATQATGDVSFSGAPGVSIPVGTVLTATNNLTLATTEIGTIAANGVVSVPVQAEQFGVASNLEAGTALALTLAGATAKVGDDGLGGAADIESDASLRARVLFRKRNPPHGGSLPDIEMWTLEVPGVTRAFASNKIGGSNVYFLMDDARPNGIPNAADLAIVQDHLSDPVRKPVGTTITVHEIDHDPINVVIEGLDPASQDVQDAVNAELADTFATRCGPSVPGSLFTLPQSWLWQAVSNATGENRHKITAPGTDLTFRVGFLPTLGQVTFT